MKVTALQAIESLLAEVQGGPLEGTAGDLLDEINRRVPAEDRCAWWIRSPCEFPVDRRESPGR